MKKNGFTLVELLAVIVIMALITVISSAGVSAVKRSIYKYLYNNNVTLIEDAAINYGEDHKSYLIKEETTSTCSGISYSPCIQLSVATLISKGYIKTKEYYCANESDTSTPVTCTDTTKKVKTLINKTVDEGSTGYYMNDDIVYVYIDNNQVYAEYIGR